MHLVLLDLADALSGLRSTGLSVLPTYKSSPHIIETLLCEPLNRHDSFDELLLTEPRILVHVESSDDGLH